MKDKYTKKQKLFNQLYKYQKAKHSNIFETNTKYMIM